MSILEVKNIQKSFGKVSVLNDISFTLEEDPAAFGQQIVQGAIGHIAVGGKIAGSRLSHLALACFENLDVIVILVGVNLVEYDLTGSHTVPALGIVGSALDDTLVFSALDNFLGVVKVFFQLFLMLGRFQRFGNILDRCRGLLFVVCADIHVVVGYRIVGGYGAHTVASDESILAGATSNHAKYSIPPGITISGVSAVPKCGNELFPGKQLPEGEVFCKAQVFPQLFSIDVNILGFKHSPDKSNQRMLFRTGSGCVCFNQLDIAQDFRR